MPGICILMLNPWRARRHVGHESMPAPSNMILPLETRSNPMINLKTVLFPAPFGPIRQRSSPRWTARCKSETAISPPKRFETPSRASSGFSLEVGAGSAMLAHPWRFGRDRARAHPGVRAGTAEHPAVDSAEQCGHEAFRHEEHRQQRDYAKNDQRVFGSRGG